MAFLKNILQRKEKKIDVQATNKISRDGAMQSVQKGGMTGVLLYPHITEKTAAAVHRRTYVFVVAPKANKQEVKKAIQARYGVTVTDIRVVTIHGKEIRRGRQIGWKQGIKKAYATLVEGQTIEVQ